MESGDTVTRHNISTTACGEIKICVDSSVRIYFNPCNNKTNDQAAQRSCGRMILKFHLLTCFMRANGLSQSLLRICYAIHLIQWTSMVGNCYVKSKKFNQKFKCHSRKCIKKGKGADIGFLIFSNLN